MNLNRLRSFFGLSAICALVTVPVFASLPAIPPVSLSAAHWTEVKLPDMPLGITVHDGHLWVFGANGLIAESADAGRTWSVRHYYPGSEMLFGLSFVNDHLAFAMGSGGTRLRSEDAGQSWKELNSSVAIRDIDFLTSEVGYGIADGVLVSTKDGGWTWKASVVRGDKHHQDRAQQVVALDAEHAVTWFGSNTDIGGAATLAETTDGGAHWEVLELPATDNITGLAVAAGAYHVFAESVSPGAPRLVHLVSSDGRNWIEGAHYPVAYHDCKAYGCLTEPGVVLFTPNGTQYETVPEPSFLMGDWAAAGATVCALSQRLHCVVGTPSPEPPIKLPLPGLPRYSPIKCHCVSPASPFRLGQHTAGKVEVEVQVGTDGRIDDFALVQASWAFMVPPVLDALRHSHYQPILENGVPRRMTLMVTWEYR
ncbi:MAG TPA: YCF48-related protein [Terriglobales bacterium]|nr:YCF48-related protein [Terriglobales bacterium]